MTILGADSGCCAECGLVLSEPEDCPLRRLCSPCLDRIRKTDNVDEITRTYTGTLCYAGAPEYVEGRPVPNTFTGRDADEQSTR